MMRSIRCLARSPVANRAALRRRLAVGISAAGGVAVASACSSPAAQAEGSEAKIAAVGLAAVGLAAAAYYTLPPSDCKNSAFVFLKPHAATDAAKALATAGLQEKGFKIVAEGTLDGTTIDQNQFIDVHYYSIASKATLLEPKELNVPADKFEAQFGIGWQEALSQGKVFNAKQAKAKLGCTDDELDALWAQAKKAKQLVKFGGGFYCGLVEGMYVFNGFFMSMRSKYTGNAKICWFVIEWDEAQLSWKDFRGQALGPTDPADAPPNSLRGQIAAQWATLGLPAACDVGDNGMHASASPLEALAERTNWLQMSIVNDAFGRALLNAGISESLIKTWSVDPQVSFDGKKCSLFDLVEDLDSSECIAKLLEIAKQN